MEEFDLIYKIINNDKLRARQISKLLARLPGPITPWIVLHSVQLLLLIMIIWS